MSKPNEASRLLFEDVFKRGLVIYPCTGTVQAVAGDMILLVPPLIKTNQQVDEIVKILEEAIQSLEKEIL